ncbi:hypothetical protein Tcan_06146 [Toxocara canis]|uniref:Uncharacterized protein n=1 Tax=Toxocara canis TaxID=6265 RepID=A0A0B2V134_TOXCA|nr:hypothetical protein Tcan_06146 [Toxocara canis]
MMRRRGSASVGGTANEDCTKPRHTQSFVVLSALSSHSAVSLCIVVALLTRQFPLTDVRLELNRGLEPLACVHVTLVHPLPERHASKLFSPSLTSTSNLPTYDISSKSVKIKSGESNINAEDEWRLKQLLPMIVNESSNKVDLLTDSFSHMAVNDGIVIRPLLTSAPPRPSIWSPITSTVDSSVEGDLEFVGMVWWHELDAERSCNIAACSRAEQFEPDFLVLDEKSKRERYLSTDTQLFDYLAESHKENVHSLEEHCKDDTATALFGCNVEGACAVRKCESFEAPSRFAGHHNLFNSTFDVSEGPVLHNVSLAEAALFNAANETETAIRSILVSRSPDRLVSGCGSASPLRWTSLEDNCRVPDGDYTSTSVVELLEEPEPESWFPDSGIFGAATNLRIEPSVETNSLWDRSQRRPICMSPQFRLPYESGILSSKSNIGSLRCRLAALLHKYACMKS